MALSNNGGDRLQYLLACFLCGLTVLSVSACSRVQPVESSDRTHYEGSALYDQLIARARATALLQDNESLQQTSTLNPTGYIQFAAPFEVWLFLAILVDDAGRHYALQQRMVRLRVSSDNVPSTSDWNFNEVFAVDFSLDRLDDGLKVSHSSAQRAALELAGADADKARVWVGAYAVESSVTGAASSALIPTDVDQCEQHYAVHAPELQLQFSQRQCIDIESTKTFAYSQSSVMPVTGTYVVDAESLNVEGHGWMVHGWGVPPDNNAAAVVFDRAWLFLGDQVDRALDAPLDRRLGTQLNAQLDVQLQRSRRRSGRGPRTTTGTIAVNDASTTPVRLVDASFNEASNDPLAWNLVVADSAVDVVIKPAFSTANSNESPPPTWFGPVAVVGSHYGFGFVSLGGR